MRPYKKKRELGNWVRRQLGAPIVDVVLDTTQLDDCIDLACDYFGEFAGGIGNQESILLISPEQVYYDGTGNANQPSPTSGRWRKPTTDPTTAAPDVCDTPDASGSPDCPFPTDTAQPKNKFGGKDGIPWTNDPTVDANGNPCPPESCLPGPGWCGDNIPDPQCFTEQGPSDPNAVGPFWVEGDTTAKPVRQGFKFKTVYDVPSDVIAVHAHMDRGFGVGQDEENNALFAPAYQLLQAGGSWGMQSPGSSVDNRWGFWMGSNGGFVDIVGYEIAMQYIQMFRTLFMTHMTAQLDSVGHKVRITPPPCDKGVIAFGCTRKVCDEAMYSHQFVRQYALGLSMRVVGMNLSKYTGMTMPGGGAVNGELYLTRGDALVEKMEERLMSGEFQEPPDFYVG